MSQAHRDPWADDLRQQLIDRRRRLGITQEDLGHRIGLTEHHLAKYEVGIRTPNAFVLTCWAEALGVRLVLAPD